MLNKKGVRKPGARSTKRPVIAAGGELPQGKMLNRSAAAHSFYLRAAQVYLIVSLSSVR